MKIHKKNSFEFLKYAEKQSFEPIGSKLPKGSTTVNPIIQKSASNKFGRFLIGSKFESSTAWHFTYFRAKVEILLNLGSSQNDDVVDYRGLCLAVGCCLLPHCPPFSSNQSCPMINSVFSPSVLPLHFTIILKKIWSSPSRERRYGFYVYM